MTYSAALFDRTSDSHESLEHAQQRKYQRALDMIDPAPGETILEIGCGWGGFAEHAAARGPRVAGVTLSKEQLAFAQQRLARARLAENTDLRLCGYRDFDERVDHIVSIEMLEAVGREYWQTYFSKPSQCLRRGGRVALQVITIDDDHFDQYAANSSGFIQSYIFPGAMLPTRTWLRRLASGAGLRDTGIDSVGVDYADTLAQWYQRFVAKTAWLEAHGYYRPFRRMWRYYLAFCEARFRAGQIDVVQCTLQKD